MSASIAAETVGPSTGRAIWQVRMTIRRKLLAGCVVLGEDLVARELVAIALVVCASAGAARSATRAPLAD